MLNIYLDTCCYNRPFDDLSQPVIMLEANAKRYIQSLIQFGIIHLTYSYVALYEIYNNPYKYRKEHILDFLSNASKFVDEREKNEIYDMSIPIMNTGIKAFDALHIACAISAECDYFLTTDKRLLKYTTDKIKLLNIVDFAAVVRGGQNG